MEDCVDIEWASWLVEAILLANVPERLAPSLILAALFSAERLRDKLCADLEAALAPGIDKYGELVGVSCSEGVPGGAKPRLRTASAISLGTRLREDTGTGTAEVRVALALPLGSLCAYITVEALRLDSDAGGRLAALEVDRPL